MARIYNSQSERWNQGLEAFLQGIVHKSTIFALLLTIDRAKTRLSATIHYEDHSLVDLCIQGLAIYEHKLLKRVDELNQQSPASPFGSDFLLHSGSSFSDSIDQVSENGGPRASEEIEAVIQTVKSTLLEGWAWISHHMGSFDAFVYGFRFLWQMSWEI